jgi:DNA-binding NarL/FixJ family response regulator
MTHLTAVYPVEVWNADSGAFEPAGTATITRSRRVLTPRRRQILVLWLTGHSHREMAAQLGVCQKTIEMALFSVKQTLEMYERPDLFLWAWDEGLIQEWITSERAAAGERRVA